MATKVRTTQDASSLLADFTSKITYKSLPAEFVTGLKCMVLDTLGTTLAASTLGDGCQAVVEVIRSMGGSRESTILPFGYRVPAAAAAFANGAMAHALNYDGGGGGHIGVLVPAPLSMAERLGNVSGKEYLAALAAGAEVTARINVALNRAGVNANEKFLEGQLVSTFGAAASAGRILGQTSKEMRSTLGLALMQCSGSMQVVAGGDQPAKAIYAAFPNHHGVLAALLSEQGLACECDALEGEVGFFAMYYGGKYVREPLVEGLGSHFYSADVRFKPWPTSGALHPFIEAAIQLVEEHRFTAKEIKRVHIDVNSRSRHWVEPFEELQQPQNAAAAANSIPFGTAKALANGKVTLDDFTPEGLRQPEALSVAERIDYSFRDGQQRGAVVEVTTNSGQHYAKQVDGPSKPMTYEQLVTKFRDCVTHSSRRIPSKTVEQVIELCNHLEDLPNVGVLADLLTGRRVRV